MFAMTCFKNRYSINYKIIKFKINKFLNEVKKYSLLIICKAHFIAKLTITPINPNKNNNRIISKQHLFGALYFFKISFSF